MTKPTAELRTYQIKATPGIHQRLERFLALLHFAGGRGHSGIFAMPLDGDGPERLVVTHPPLVEYKDEAELIGGVGHEVEVAYNRSYGAKKTVPTKSVYTTGRIFALYRNEDVIKTLPRISTEVDIRAYPGLSIEDVDKTLPKKLSTEEEETEDENLNDE